VCSRLGAGSRGKKEDETSSPGETLLRRRRREEGEEGDEQDKRIIFTNQVGGNGRLGGAHLILVRHIDPGEGHPNLQREKREKVDQEEERPARREVNQPRVGLPRSQDTCRWGNKLSRPEGGRVEGS